VTDILDATPEGQVDIVYLGDYMSDKLRTRWMPLAALEQLGAGEYDAARRVASLYTKKGTSGRVIGGIYTAKATLEGDTLKQVWFGTLKYSGQCAHPLVKAFEADSILAREAESAKRAENAAKASPAIMRDLDRTVAALRAVPLGQALKMCDAIKAELTRQVLSRR
jgi:hypothetical protein